jgi:hypothetical protein
MKPEDPQASVPCLACGHLKSWHLMVCGDRDCECLCFIPSDDSDGCALDVLSWDEKCIASVLDLVLGEQEGEVEVRTPSGARGRILVRFEPELGYTISKGAPS